MTTAAPVAPPVSRRRCGRSARARCCPAEAYTSPAVLAWERRHFFAASWTCVGRVDELLPDGAHPGGAAPVGDVSVLLARDPSGAVRGASPTPAGTAVTSCSPRATRRASARSSARTTPGATTSPAACSRRPASGRSRPSTRRRTAWCRCRSRCGTAGCSSTRGGSGYAVRRARRRAGGAGRAVRARTARPARDARLRRRGELEGHHRELPRVLPLPADPPGAVPGQPTVERGELRPARRLGRRLDGPARRRRDDVARRPVATGGRSTASTRGRCSTSGCCPTCCCRCTPTT